MKSFSLPLALAASLTAPLSAQKLPPDYPANVARQVAKVHAANTQAGQSQSAPFAPTWNSLARYRAPTWFQDAKFGIFLHWGVYSVPAFGNEWYSRNMYVPGNAAFKHQLATYGPQDQFGYKDFIPMFKAQHFDPNAWVSLFAQAGARYVVPVAEHCDGFALYASDITPWNAAQMGPHRDIVGELATATRAHGLHFGVSSHTAEHWWWYGLGRTLPSDVRKAMAPSPHPPLDRMLYGPAASMSLPGPGEELNQVTGDAAEPNPSHLELWLPPDQPFLDNWLALSTELVDKYHPDFLYFDWWIGQPAFQPGLQQFAAYYYNDAARRHAPQPVLTYKQEDFPANAATLDIERGKIDTLRLLPWQTDTSVSVHSWGYVENDVYRTAPSLLQQLVDAVSKNGNLLLNVGPRSDGTIPEEAKTVLLQMGAWLQRNGEAIYGSRPFAVFGEGPTVAPKDSTAKNRDIQTYTPQDIRYTTSNTTPGMDKPLDQPGQAMDKPGQAMDKPSTKHRRAPCIAASPRCVGSKTSHTAPGAPCIAASSRCVGSPASHTTPSAPCIAASSRCVGSPTSQTTPGAPCIAASSRCVGSPTSHTAPGAPCIAASSRCVGSPTSHTTPGAPCIAASSRCVGSLTSRATLYATVMSWPTTGSLTLHVLFTGNPYLPAPVCSATLVGSTAKIPLTQSPDGLHLTLPTTPPLTFDPAYPAVFRLQTCS